MASDHRGFELKERLKKRLIEEGLKVVDLGNDHLDPQDDYVDFAHRVAEAVAENPENRGVLLCGSGVGVDVVANKVKGVRSALVSDVKRAVGARTDDNANVISLPADILDEEMAYEIIKAFLTTDFSAEPRYVRRLKKLEKIEKSH